MPLSAFQQFCADTGCPDNAHTLALWTQRNDAVAANLQHYNEAIEQRERAERAEIERDKLKAELSKFQLSEFNPDWSLLQASQESLREHMQIIGELNEQVNKLKAEREQMEEENRELARMLNTELSGGTFMGEPAMPNKHWETREMAHLDAQVAKCPRQPVPDGKVLVPNPAHDPRVRIEYWTGTYWAPYGAADFDAAMLKAAQQEE